MVVRPVSILVNQKSITAQPFLKWAGGKRKLIQELQMRFPEGIGQRITKYAEPFIGGGALFFHLLQNSVLKEYLISDANPELYIAYKTIQESVEDVIDRLSKLEEQYIKSNSEKRADLFYKTRTSFNKGVKKIDLAKPNNAKRTAQIIFLNRTCFNGLFRVNSKGEFNVPHGRYVKPTINNFNNLRAVSGVLKKVEIRCGDYSSCTDWIDEKTLVYFDPPYRPLTTSSAFTSYSTSSFADKQQKELAKFCIKLKEKGASVIVSNSDPKNIDTNDDFFEDLYEGFQFHRVLATRAINCNGNKRGAISELIITSFEVS